MLFCRVLGYLLCTTGTLPCCRKRPPWHCEQREARQQPICPLEGPVHASCFQTFLCTHGRVSRAQFAVWAHTCVADVLRVVHDWFLFCWSRGQQGWLVLDNVIHAFGSLAHATIQSTLLAAGCSAPSVDLLVFAIRSMLLHMGGFQGVEEALARYEAGLGQGDPISALLYCLLGELHAALALASTGLLATPAGPLRRLGWVDDTSWLGASHADAQHVVSTLPASRAATNILSDNVKTIAIGIELRLGRLHILSEPLYLLGSPLQRPGQSDFIHLLGRHPLSHRFHRQELAKIMKVGRRATAAMTQLSLPSHYPISMYNGVAGGTQQWCAHVQPHLYRTMRLGDLPVASRLRCIWHLDASTPPEAFLQPLRTGWVGLESSPYIMYSSFMETYNRQLNHSNLVRAFTCYGLLQAKQKFHPSMQCLATATPQECLSHADDHSRFLALCHRVCREVHVPQEPLHVPTVFNPMHLCVHEWQTNDVQILDGCRLRLSERCSPFTLALPLLAASASASPFFAKHVSDVSGAT